NGRQPVVPCPPLDLAPLGKNGIADRGPARAARRAVLVNLAPLGLTVRRAVAQADAVLVRIELHDLEVVLLANLEERGLAGLGLLVLVALVAAALFDLRDVAE